MKPIVLALVGPTGVGKTQVSLDSARVERGNSFNGFYASLSRNGYRYGEIHARRTTKYCTLYDRYS